MIIWLASYPKSGNTLLRAMLSAYLFSENGNFDFKLLNNIKQFPSKHYFEDLGIDIKNRDQIVKNYLKAQEVMGKSKTVGFLKTHNMLYNFEKKYSFTNLEYSVGVIYIVRDPRNVVLSYSHHLNVSIEKTAKLMTIGKGNDLDLMGNWSENYQSWKNFKKYNKYLLIKYEDLVSNPNEIFLKILKFIYKLRNLNFSLDNNKFDKMLETTKFDNLKILEKKQGFPESTTIKKTGKRITFFNKGSKRNWSKSLDPIIKSNIENTFKEEMIELGYL
jgi:hypothetical protein